MEIVGSGVIWDARSAPVNLRSTSATSVMRISDGTLLATSRMGPDREGPDGQTAIFASGDGRESWELRWLGLTERHWDDWPGETRGWFITELTPGELTAAVLCTDRSDPARPWVNPVTQGLGAWQFGHPRGVALPDGRVLVVFYGGAGSDRSMRWARIAS